MQKALQRLREMPPFAREWEVETGPLPSVFFRGEADSKKWRISDKEEKRTTHVQRRHVGLRMANKKKTEKKEAKSLKTAGKNAAQMRKAVKNREKMAKRRVNPRKKLAKKKAAPRKAEVKTKADGKKITVGKTASALKKQVRGKSQPLDTVAFALEGLGVRSGERSGDLQGLSNVQSADSESVDELLKEGNVFEADVVKGVEDADDGDEREVRTHEVPQDDVPGEYLDKSSE